MCCGGVMCWCQAEPGHRPPVPQQSFHHHDAGHSSAVRGPRPPHRELFWRPDQAGLRSQAGSTSRASITANFQVWRLRNPDFFVLIYRRSVIIGLSASLAILCLLVILAILFPGGG